MQRRHLLQALALLPLGLPFAAHAALPQIEVFKSAGCGCCEEWIKHLQAYGFAVKAQDVPDTAVVRARLGISAELGSCHTAQVGAYALEGHVPAADIKRLLAEKPKAIGLAVPGMPMGSPGMEGHRMDAYDVVLIAKNGKRSVYRHYP